jgi:hypothetical protein
MVHVVGEEHGGYFVVPMLSTKRNIQRRLKQLRTVLICLDSLAREL